MPVQTYNNTGNKTTSNYLLPKNLFGVEINNYQLLKDDYLAYLAHGRSNLAKTLKRGEVSGGGAKPWRQKGTGRARVGSSRNPIWRGGGVTFGPEGTENYHKKLNRKAKNLALAQALTLSVKKQIIITDGFIIKNGKTKNALTLLAKYGAKRRVLIVTDNIDSLTSRSLSNLKLVDIISANRLNAYETLNADTLIITKKAIKALEVRIGVDK